MAGLVGVVTSSEEPSEERDGALTSVRSEP